MKLRTKIAIFSTTAFFLLMLFSLATYLYILPKAIETTSFQNLINSTLNLNLAMDNPKLETSLSSKIGFSVKELTLKKAEITLAELNDFKIKFCLKNIFKKELRLDNLQAKKIIIDADKLQNLIPAQQSTIQTNPDFSFKFLNSTINLDEIKTNYTLNNSKINLEVNNFTLNDKKISLDVIGKISKNKKEYIKLSINSKDEIIINKEKIEVKK